MSPNPEFLPSPEKENFPKKIFLICSVRGATPEHRRELEEYTLQLERDGAIVHLPHRDTNQCATGLEICEQNFWAVVEADEVHIVYNPESQGSHFDMGVAFALGKPVVFVNEDQFPQEIKITAKKSFPQMLKQWQDNGVNRED